MYVKQNVTKHYSTYMDFMVHYLKESQENVFDESFN